jgi:hypothetical protein
VNGGTAVFLILFGLAFVGFGMWMIRQRKKVETWPSVMGHIDERELIWEYDSSSGTGPRTTRYAPSVLYSYAVDGTGYHGDTVELGGTTWTTKRRAKKWLASFPDDVPVHYDPEDPSNSCLSGPTKGSAYFFSAVGVAITLAGVVIGVIAAL